MLWSEQRPSLSSNQTRSSLSVNSLSSRETIRRIKAARATQRYDKSRSKLGKIKKSKSFLLSRNTSLHFLTLLGLFVIVLDKKCQSNQKFNQCNLHYKSIFVDPTKKARKLPITRVNIYLYFERSQCYLVHSFNY